MEKYLNFDFDKQSDRLKFFVYCFILALILIVIGDIMCGFLTIAGISFIILGFLLVFIGGLPQLKRML